MILDHYYPQSYRDKKEVEFVNLQQRTMTVVAYERRFNQLSRYTSYLVDTEGKKVRRFERGLCLEIAEILAGLELSTYSEVNRRAHAITTSLGLETLIQKKPCNAPSPL